MRSDTRTRLGTALGVGLGGAAGVAGALAMAGAGAAIARAPEGFQEPALVFVIFSRMFLGYGAVAAPVALLCATALLLRSRGTASTADLAFPVVVAVLLAVAAILDQAFALDPETLEPAVFAWRSALLGVCAAVGVGALLARVSRGVCGRSFFCCWRSPSGRS